LVAPVPASDGQGPDEQLAAAEPLFNDALPVLRGSVLITVAALAMAAFAAAGQSSSTQRDPKTLSALVAEWSVVPSVGVVSAGLVRIRVRNVGVEPHELVLARTARFADSLPLADDRAQATAIGPSLLVAPGQTASAVFRLRPGSYVLLDNLPWHYWQGTWAAFAAR
jgi:uncharacterized cupredoxin-like copper-binding protein